MRLDPYALTEAERARYHSGEWLALPPVAQWHPGAQALYGSGRYAGALWPSKVAAKWGAVPLWMCKHRHEDIAQATYCAREERAERW